MKIRVVAISVLLSLSTQAFAVCEQEREEYADWNSKCETLSASSQVAGVAGGFFAIVTFGASMAPCAALIASAANACRIRNEKRNNLTRCENHHAELARQEAAQVEAARVREEGRIAKINEINSRYSNLKSSVEKQYQEKANQFIESYLAEGWDTESHESKEFIRQVKVDFEKELNSKLDQIEDDRKNEIKDV